eukprot:COSAG03_NODE_21593_length_302_cov_0.955665_1_plen_54_part_10
MNLLNVDGWNKRYVGWDEKSIELRTIHASDSITRFCFEQLTCFPEEPVHCGRAQ